MLNLGLVNSKVRPYEWGPLSFLLLEGELGFCLRRRLCRKMLLPVVDTPGIELIAEEAAAVGADRLAIITAPNKQEVMRHSRIWLKPLKRAVKKLSRRRLSVRILC